MSFHPDLLRKLNSYEKPSYSKEEGRYWYEVGIVQEDDSTMTIGKFALREDAQAFQQKFSKENPEVKSFIDVWEMVGGIPTPVYNLT